MVRSRSPGRPKIRCGPKSAKSAAKLLRSAKRNGIKVDSKHRSPKRKLVTFLLNKKVSKRRLGCRRSRSQ